MALDLGQRNSLLVLAAADRTQRARAEEARRELLKALREARGDATLRELSEVTGISFQRIGQMLADRP